MPQGGESSSSSSGGSITVVNQGAGGGGGGGNFGGDAEGPSVSPEVAAERTPDDIPPPTYDDIVARQLREAAQAEEDPVIREKLWDEYRKYKGI